MVSKEKDRVSEINCVVFKRENDGYKFLVLLRRKDIGGFWQSITGGVKPGENDEEAVERELQEETGIMDYARLVKLNYSYSFNLPPYGDLVENCYAVEISPGTKVSISDEHTDYKWLTLEEAIELVNYQTNKEAFRRLWKILVSK